MSSVTAELQSWTNGGTSHFLPLERSLATFDIETMTSHMDGGKKNTMRRRWIQNSSDTHILDDIHNLSRAELTAKSVKHFVDIHMPHIKRGFMPQGHDVGYMSGGAISSGPLMPHYSLFIMTLAGQASPEQQAVWLPKAYMLEIIGAYAQTELGHGSNVRGLQTVATYDKTTEEFVLNTPTLQSMKWWNSNAGLFATHCTLYAQLVIDGVPKGVHVFFVQLRDENHKLLPGIDCGDCGLKLGDNAIDTGYIRLKNVRIPREHLLAKRQHVEKDGTYVKHGSENSDNGNNAASEKLHYLTMMGARSGMVSGAADALAIGCVIAIRYSAVRHQGFKSSSSEMATNFTAEESPILDYKYQQYRLFSNLANCYAFKIVGNAIRDIMSNIQKALSGAENTLVNDLPEVHASTAGLKGMCTKFAHDGLEDLRKCCGGHGFLMNSGIAKLTVDYSWKVTAEGDWVVMLLQTARFLMKMVDQAKNGNGELNLPGLCKVYEKLRDKSFDPVADFAKSPKPRNVVEFINLENLLNIYKYRTLLLSVETENDLVVETKRCGGDAQVAWNNCAVQLVKTAIAHCQYFVLDKFIQNIQTCENEDCRKVLVSLCQTYALSNLTTAGNELIGLLDRNGTKLLNDGLNYCLETIRPNAVALADALDIGDHILHSSLGSYDGRVYERLFAEAQDSPLNHEPLKGYEFVENYLNKDFLKLANSCTPELKQSKL